MWETNELREILGGEAAAIFIYHYGAKEDGNVNPEQDPHDELRNKVWEWGKLLDIVLFFFLSFHENVV